MKRKQTVRRQSAPSVHRAVIKNSGTRHSRREHQLKSILELTTACYGSWKLYRGQLCLSDQWLTALGYSTADGPKGHVPANSLMHPEDQIPFQSALDAHLAGDTPALVCEFRLRARAGSYRCFQIRGKVVRRDRTGIPVQLAGMVLDVHERRRKEEGLARSHEQLAAIVQASQDCISVVDPKEFRLVAFNKSFADLIFKAHGVHVSHGMRVEDIVPDRAQEWNEYYRQVLAEGTISRDYDLLSLNATHHMVAQCLTHDGRVYAIGVSGHDVTDRKQIEQALRKSEETFSKVFHESPLALSLTSLRDHRYLEVNESFLEATGYHRGEVIGKTPSDIGLWVEPEQRTDVIKQVLATGEARNIEISYRTKFGEIHQAMGSAVLIDIEGEPCMLGVVVDITDRKRAVEAVRESEERLRTAIEAGRMYAFEWDIASDIVQRSKQSSKMLGLPDDGIKHTKQELLDRLQPEERQNYISVLESLTPQKSDYKVVFRLPSRDGHTAWLEESGRAIFGADGKLRKVIGITSDVTEFRESERILRELSGRLITAQEEERRRIARELHDNIGQEAALLCVLAQRIDSGDADSEHTTHSDVHDLYRRIKVLAGDVSKLSHHLHSSELTFLGLEVAAERLCRDFENQYGIDIDYQVKTLPPTLDSAKSLCLYRVLQEALQNVAKHSRASKIVVETTTINNELTLVVKDNGKGFDVEKTRLDSGLGLLSMRERLNLVGGRFAIVSYPGSGTTVTAKVLL